MPRYIDADALIKRWSDEHGGAYFLPSEIVSSIEEQPTVDIPERNVGKWIPVTERLPDLWDERYLVSLAWGGVGVMEYKSTGFHNYGSFSPVPIETVTAWMPLPKPYERSEHD